MALSLLFINLIDKKYCSYLIMKNVTSLIEIVLFAYFKQDEPEKSSFSPFSQTQTFNF